VSRTPSPDAAATAAATTVAASHVVDSLIEERAPTLFRRPLTRWVMRHLAFPYLAYDETKEVVDRIAPMTGAEIMDLGVDYIGMRIRTLGLARLPAKGRVVIVVNHPTGLADGVALWGALTPVREDLKILANGDELRLAKGLGDVFVPVEWVKTRRTAAGSRRILVEVANAFRSEAAVVIFPSGRLAHLTWRGLTERPWIATAVTLARKFEAPIVPLHIRARNSWWFYLLSQLSTELRDVTLFKELLNKRGRRFDLTLGLPIDPAGLPDDPGEAVRLLQRHVEHELPRASRGQPPILATGRPRPLVGAGP
jgi:putative hemolysin